MDMISSYVQNVEMDAKLALSSIAMQNIKGILVVPADILIAILLPQNLAISFGTKNAIRKMSLDTLVLTAVRIEVTTVSKGKITCASTSVVTTRLRHHMLGI
ncbi:hypothetical protein ACMFMF_005977 [Clarireedia jacksonii]